MRAVLGLSFGRIVGTIALCLVVLALAACGSAAEPEATTVPPESEAPAAATSEEATASTAPSPRLAPTFDLPNAAGESISLASYAGDKNVVLVFYRGFW